MGQLVEGKLVTEGYNSVGFGIEYWKEHDGLFKESHAVLQEFLYQPGKFDYTWSVQMCSDPDADRHPEVYAAWRAAGGDENIQTVSKLPELGKWAVGFGGKKNAERAAKLALAVAIACDSEATPIIARNYPQFGKFLTYLGICEAPAAAVPQ